MSLKTILIKIIRKLVFKLGYLYFILKCEFFFLTQMGAGLSYVIENLPPRFIIPILKKYGASIGKNCQIDTGIIIHRVKTKQDFAKLIIGDKVYIGHRMVLDITEPITIGSYSAFGANCQIWTHTGDWTLDRSNEKDKTNPVTIGKSVIFYSACIISQGTIVGDFARVGAGSVVIKSIPEKEFWVGAPAKFIKKRDI